MANILEFIPNQPAKFGYERVKRKRKIPGTHPGQLSLFSPAGQVYRLPSNQTPFEEALLMDERDDRRAEELYRQAISEGESVGDAYCNLGIIMSKTGLTAKAFDCFTKSLESNPRHFESHYNLGNVYFEEGDLRLARMHYELAAEIEPDRASVYFNLGLVVAMSEDFSSALDALKKYKTLASREEGTKVDDLLEKLERSLNAHYRS